ncbi:MAG: hypothetical protein ACI4TW_02880 [Prevotella sp.]
MKHLKSIFSTLAAVLMISLTATTFIACGDDDDEEEVSVKTYASMDYKFEVGDTLLHIADITVEYYRGGELVKEKITENKWSASSGLTKIPTKLGYKVTMTLKENMEFNDPTYLITYHYWNNFVFYYDQNKKEIYTNEISKEDKEYMIVEKDYLQDYFEVFGKEEYFVDAN